MEHGHGHGSGCYGESCGCHHGGHVGHGGRHYFTSEEKATHLDQYLEQLKAEAAGVEEELKKLKGA